jgi:hypothetical protein
MTWILLAQSWPSSEQLTQNVGLIVLKVLAVAGGALVGGLGCGFGGAALARLLYGGKLPRQVVTILQIVGGILSAWLVAFLVFWPGGEGTGGGGGGGTGQGTGPGSGGQTGQTNPGATNTGSPVKVVDGAVLQVKVLRGGGKDNPIYEIDVDGQPTKFKLSDLLGQIKLKQKQDPGVSKIEVLLRWKETPDEDTDQVLALRKEAHYQLGLESSVHVAGKPYKKDRLFFFPPLPLGEWGRG